MRDILSFINSKDIRDYLCRIGYVCNIREATWLVHHSHNTSVKEKLMAWEHILEEMPDCPIEHSKKTSKASLHLFLREYMEVYRVWGERIETENDVSGISEREREILNYMDYLWCDFPLPFQKGDIVIDCLYDAAEFHGNYCYGPFVLDYVNNDSSYSKWDSTDMNGFGYFQDEDGSIYYDSMWNYMDLIRYTGQLNGQERLLIAISSYLRNDIGLNLLMASQRWLTLQNYDKEWNDDFLNYYTEEGKRLAGLTDYK